MDGSHRKFSPFHGENTGSIPVGRTSYLFIEINVLE